MEAFSAFEEERKRHNRFVGELEGHIRQLERNVVSPRIQTLIDHLRRSVVELQAIFNDSQSRLFEAVENLRTRAELIGLTPEILETTLTRLLIDDPTDNLILTSILDHAGSKPSEGKVFLSENRKDFNENLLAKVELEKAGIKYFSQASNFLGWNKSQSESEIGD
jgi:hypothetical protein